MAGGLRFDAWRAASERSPSEHLGVESIRESFQHLVVARDGRPAAADSRGVGPGEADVEPEEAGRVEHGPAVQEEDAEAPRPDVQVQHGAVEVQPDLYGHPIAAPDGAGARWSQPLRDGP